MFKRSGALSGTRRASKKQSPLPKRSARKEADVTEKGSEKTSGKKNALLPPSEHGDLEKSSENELSLESVVESVSFELENDNQITDDQSVGQQIKDPSPHSNVDSILDTKDDSGDIQDDPEVDTVSSQDFEEVCAEVSLSTPHVNDQQFDKDGEDLDLKSNENLDITDTELLKADSKDSTSIEEAKLETDLLIDAEDSETFQDLSSKVDVGTERNTEDSKALEMKSSDTSGLVSGGVISLQYPDDDARSLGSAQLEDHKSESQKDDKVIKCFFLLINCTDISVRIALLWDIFNSISA